MKIQPNYWWVAVARLVKLPCAAWLGLVLFTLLQTASGQGFVNLNFEQAGFYVPPTPVGGWGDFIDPALAFHGWTVGANPTGNTVTFYNDLSLGSPAVGLMGPNFPNAPGYSPLQGSYSVLLQYFGYAGGPPTLSQTGFVPANAESINFLVSAGTGAGAARVTLDGVDISLVPIAGGRLAGDVSSFAGRTAQLTFSTPSNGGWLYFDDIRFSSLPVPEPISLRLLAVGALFIGCIAVYRSGPNLKRRPTRPRGCVNGCS